MSAVPAYSLQPILPLSSVQARCLTDVVVFDMVGLLCLLNFFFVNSHQTLGWVDLGLRDASRPYYYASAMLCS